MALSLSETFLLTLSRADLDTDLLEYPSYVSSCIVGYSSLNVKLSSKIPCSSSSAFLAPKDFVLRTDDFWIMIHLAFAFLPRGGRPGELNDEGYGICFLFCFCHGHYWVQKI